MIDKRIILQAHRGFHSGKTENSLDACIEAISLDISCIEIDIVVSRDKKLIVSHDPYISSEIHVHKDGKAISQSEEKALNIYQMDWEAVSEFPFTDTDKNSGKQGKTSLIKLVQAIDKHCQEHEIRVPILNIEVKSHPDFYGSYFPAPDAYAEILNKEIRQFPKEFPFLIQSFDIEILKKCSDFITKERLILLIDQPEIGSKEILKAREMGLNNFGLNHKNTSADFIEFSHNKGFDVSLWTVNLKEDFIRFYELGIRNFITDNPVELSQLAESKGIEIIRF